MIKSFIYINKNKNINKEQVTKKLVFVELGERNHLRGNLETKAGPMSWIRMTFTLPLLLSHVVSPDFIHHDCIKYYR